MTSRCLRKFLPTRTPFTSSVRNATGPGEFREIRYTGYAPKYRDEFAKLRVQPPDPPVFSGEVVTIAITFVATSFFCLKKAIVHWKQEAEHRRNTEYRKAMNRVVDDLSQDYRMILDTKFPN